MSAVAFAAKNCALESMTISGKAVSAARRYESGDLSIDGLVDACIENDLDDDATDLIFARTVLFIEHPCRQTYDLAELSAIHRILFEQVYPDAGRLRTHDTAVNMYHVSPDDMAANSQAFFPASMLETGAANIASELAEHRNLRCMDREDFVRSLAHFYDELGYLHPFSKDNAMTLRIFASRIAHAAGWDLDWGPIDADEYKTAKRLAYHGDTSGFRMLFDRIVRPANPTRVFLIAGWDQGPAH